MSWREHSLDIISARIKALRGEPGFSSLSSDEKKQRIKNAVDSHYPYSQRSGWAYQSWLDARADIFAQWGIPTRRVKQRPPCNRKGWRKPIVIVPGQMTLFDGVITNSESVQP